VWRKTDTLSDIQAGNWTRAAESIAYEEYGPEYMRDSATIRKIANSLAFHAKRLRATMPRGVSQVDESLAEEIYQATCEELDFTLPNSRGTS